MPSLTLSPNTTRRLLQTAVDIHPRQSQSAARRSLLKPRLRATPTRPARYTPRPASRLPQSCRHLHGLAKVTSATPQRFELLLQFHRKNTRRLIQTAIDIHPRESQSGAMRSLPVPRLRVTFLHGLPHVTSATPQRFSAQLLANRKNSIKLKQMRIKN